MVDTGKAVLQIHLALAQRFHFRPGQGNTRLVRFVYEIIVTGLTVIRNIFLSCPFSHFVSPYLFFFPAFLPDFLPCLRLFIFLLFLSFFLAALLFFELLWAAEIQSRFAVLAPALPPLWRRSVRAAIMAMKLEGHLVIRFPVEVGIEYLPFQIAEDFIHLQLNIRKFLAADDELLWIGHAQA